MTRRRHADRRASTAARRSPARARYTAEIALPGPRAPGDRRRDGRQRARRRRSTPRAARARRRRARRPHAREPRAPDRRRAAACCPRCSGRPAPGESFFPMQDDVVHYAGQPVALVVADSHERAQHAASLVRVAYEAAPSVTTIEQGRDARLRGGAAVRRADARRATSAATSTRRSRAADVRVDAAVPDRRQPPQPDRGAVDGRGLGRRAADAVRLDDGHPRHPAHGRPPARPAAVARARARPFVGGGFGSKAMVWPHVTLTAMAARQVGRPVRLTLTRPQMFTSHGQREEQEQRIALGATRDGRLTAIRHEKLSITSPFDDWAEPATGVSLAAVRVRALRGRAPADPRQHDDADVHARARRVARRLRARDGDGRARLRRSASTPSSCGCATTRRSTRAATRGRATACRSACAAAPSASAGRERDPTPRARRDGDWLIGHRHGRGGLPDRVLHARAARAGADPRRRQRGRADRRRRSSAPACSRWRRRSAADALGVDARARVRFRGRRHRPAQQRPRRSARPARAMVSSAVHAAGRALRDAARRAGDRRRRLAAARRRPGVGRPSPAAG